MSKIEENSQLVTTLRLNMIKAPLNNLASPTLSLRIRRLSASLQLKAKSSTLLKGVDLRPISFKIKTDKGTKKLKVQHG
jgi:hypothetical protein